MAGWTTLGIISQESESEDNKKGVDVRMCEIVLPRSTTVMMCFFKDEGKRPLYWYQSSFSFCYIHCHSVNSHSDDAAMTPSNVAKELKSPGW